MIGKTHYGGIEFVYNVRNKRLRKFKLNYKL
jgi:hypothetical protein